MWSATASSVVKREAIFSPSAPRLAIFSSRTVSSTMPPPPTGLVHNTFGSVIAKRTTTIKTTTNKQKTILVFCNRVRYQQMYRAHFLK